MGFGQRQWQHDVAEPERALVNRADSQPCRGQVREPGVQDGPDPDVGVAGQRAADRDGAAGQRGQGSGLDGQVVPG